MSETSCKTCSKQDAKFRCGGCKKVWYCSQECQRKNWTAHKTDCSFNPGSQLISIVLVKGSEAFEEKIKKEEVCIKNGWIPCEMTNLLGVPIMVKRWRPYPPGYRPDWERGIFLMVDPVSGLAAQEWQAGCGVIAFAKADKTDMSVQLFWDLYSYIYHLMDYYGESNFNYPEFKKQSLNYESFREYQKWEHEGQAEFKKMNMEHFQ